MAYADRLAGTDELYGARCAWRATGTNARPPPYEPRTTIVLAPTHSLVLSSALRWNRASLKLQIQIQETAFLVQIVLKKRFLVLDFGVYHGA
eukprot:3935714-Rhodomonas_salina.5